MSNVLTLGQAAKLIGVSQRSVHRYIRKGYLRRATKGRGSRVFEDDAERLRKTVEEPLPISINKFTFVELYEKVIWLERQMASVLHVLNLRQQPLQRTDAEMFALFKMAERHLNEGWSPPDEPNWVEIFLQLKREHIEQIERTTNCEDPWLPLYQLAAAMHLAAYDGALKEKFLAGRENIRAIGEFWVRLKGRGPRTLDLLIKRDSVPFNRLLRLLDKRKTKSSANLSPFER